MGDWEFLYEMTERGYSADEIAAAASSGAAPWEWEYLDRDWVETQLEEEAEEDADPIEPGEYFQSREGFPFSFLDQTEIFLDLIECAARHFENTGRYLQIWGELGEIFSEIHFGLRRHGSRTAGSDGTIAGKLVEVKTISPEKRSKLVRVKSQGDFEQLLVVSIDQDFQFRGKLFERGELKFVDRNFLGTRLQNEANRG